MKMNKFINLITTTMCISFIMLANTQVQSTRAHVETVTKQSTVTTKTTISKKSHENTATKKVVTKQKTTNETSTKKSATKTQAPLTEETAASISGKLPNYFSSWMNCGSKCSKATLTYKDVLKLIEDGKISGQESAVLGAVVTYINNLGTPNSAQFTLRKLQELFTNDTGDIYSTYYKNAITNINNERALPEKDKLFGRYQETDGKWHSGISAETQIIQNSLGDCFTLSSINGMLHYPGGPKKLEEMISLIPGHPDEYWVNFPGYAKPILVRFTMTKLAMYSELVNGGKWLAILSDAVAKARRDNPESGIFNGGYQTFVLRLLTGKSYRNEALSPFNTQQVQLLKDLDDNQYYALEVFVSGSTNEKIAEQLQALSTLTEAQLKSKLTKAEIDAFKQLTPAQIALLQSLTPAQWNEVSTLIYNNQGNVNKKLLDRSLKANRTNQEISDQLNNALNNDNPPHIIGIETNEHDLTVLAYNPTTQTLTIKNPWGDTGWYNPVKGYFANENTKESTPPWFNMSNGVFTVTLSQLVDSNFVTITIPISHSSDDRNKLATAARQATVTGGQISAVKQVISQAQSSMKKATDVKKVEIGAAIREANTALDQLNTALTATSNCQTDACESTLANAEEAVDAANSKLTTVMKQ